MPTVYGRTKDGNIYHCSGTNRDGQRCGRRVSTPGSRCWQHRRQRMPDIPPGPLGHDWSSRPRTTSPAEVAATLTPILAPLTRETDSVEGLRIPPPRPGFGSGEWNTTVHALIGLVFEGHAMLLGPYRVEREADGGYRVYRSAAQTVQGA